MNRAGNALRWAGGSADVALRTRSTGDRDGTFGGKLVEDGIKVVFNRVYPLPHLLGIERQDGGHALRGVGRAGLRRVLTEDGRESLQLHFEFCSVVVGFEYASPAKRELCAVFCHATVVLEL